MHKPDTTNPPDSSRWVHKRDKPKGKEAQVATAGKVAQCMPGDVVLMNDKQYQVAWCYSDGDVAARRDCSTKSEALDILKAGEGIEWQRVAR